MKILLLVLSLVVVGCNKDQTSTNTPVTKAVAVDKNQPNLQGLEKEEDCDDEVDYKKPAEEVVVDLTSNEDEGCSLE